MCPFCFSFPHVFNQVFILSCCFRARVLMGTTQNMKQFVLGLRGFVLGFLSFILSAFLYQKRLSPSVEAKSSTELQFTYIFSICQHHVESTGEKKRKKSCRVLLRCQVFSSPVYVNGKTPTEERLGSRQLRTLSNLVFCYLCLPLLQCDSMPLHASGRDKREGERVIKIVLGDKIVVAFRGAHIGAASHMLFSALEKTAHNCTTHNTC